MRARFRNASASSTCTKCGVHADAGRVFCANCTATLQTPRSLIQPAPEDCGPLSPAMSPIKRKAFLLGFPLSVLLDIVLGIITSNHVIRIILVFIVPVFLVGIPLVAFGTVTKNRWGINTKPLNCPSCGYRMPQVRQPRSIRQALWGGGTCGRCGCEMDKWGRLSTLAH